MEIDMKLDQILGDHTYSVTTYSPTKLHSYFRNDIISSGCGKSSASTSNYHRKSWQHHLIVYYSSQIAMGISDTKNNFKKARDIRLNKVVAIAIRYRTSWYDDNLPKSAKGNTHYMYNLNGQIPEDASEKVLDKFSIINTLEGTVAAFNTIIDMYDKAYADFIKTDGSHKYKCQFRMLVFYNDGTVKSYSESPTDAMEDLGIRVDGDAPRVYVTLRGGKKLTHSSVLYKTKENGK